MVCADRSRMTLPPFSSDDSGHHPSRKLSRHETCRVSRRSTIATSRTTSRWPRSPAATSGGRTPGRASRRWPPALGPAYVRESGSWANSIYFHDADTPAPEKAPNGFDGAQARMGQWGRFGAPHQRGLRYLPHASTSTCWSICGESIRHPFGVRTTVKTTVCESAFGKKRSPTVRLSRILCRMVPATR